MNVEAAPMRPWSTVRTAVSACLLAVSYFVGVHASFALTLEHAPVALLWAPNALLLAALLLCPRRTWLVLIGAALLAHVLCELSEQQSLVTVVGRFVANATGVCIGAWAIWSYLQRSPRFDQLQDLRVFLLGAPLLSAAISALLDTSLAAAMSGYDDFWTQWCTRMLSNALAMLVLVPPIVHLAQTTGRFTRPRVMRRIIAGVALLIGLWSTSALVYWKQQPEPRDLISLFSTGEQLAGVISLQIFLMTAAVLLLLQCVSLRELRYVRRILGHQGERLQLALSAARMGTWEWEVGSPRLTWSNSAYDLAGTELPSETTLTRMLQQIHHDDCLRVRAAFEAVSNGANHLEVEFRWLSTDDLSNDSGWVTAIGKVTQCAGVRRILGVHKNISEGKQQELRLQEQREQLWHLSRVAMLTELSGALAHELHQPLTAMLANAEAARDHLLKGSVGEVQAIIEDIVTDNERAAGVIRRLRALFAPRTSHAGRVSINKCVRDVLSLAHSEIAARNITLDVRIARNVPDVRADPIQLQQVLLNLVLNACDAMRDNPPAERYLRVSTRLTLEGEVGLDVYDRGVGINDIDKIFEPFFTTKHHGLGLGLAISQTIVSAHRGRLWATNNPDRGATIHVVLPVENPNSGSGAVE